MAAVIRSTIFFLASIPIPGGASIRQTGTTASLHVKTPTFSNCGATRGSRALRDSEDQMRYLFMELLGGSSRLVGLLALLSAWAGRVSERSRRRSLVAIT